MDIDVVSPESVMKNETITINESNKNEPIIKETEIMTNEPIIKTETLIAEPVVEIKTITTDPIKTETIVTKKTTIIKPTIDTTSTTINSNAITTTDVPNDNEKLINKSEKPITPTRRTASLKRNKNSPKLMNSPILTGSPKSPESPRSFIALPRTSSIRSIHSDSSNTKHLSDDDNSDQEKPSKTQTTYLLPSLVPRKICTNSPKITTPVPVNSSNTTTTTEKEKEKDVMSFIDSLKTRFIRNKNDVKKENEAKTDNNTTITDNKKTNIKTTKTTSNSNIEEPKKSEGINDTKIKHLTEAIEAKDAEIKDRVEIIKQYADTLLSL